MCLFPLVLTPCVWGCEQIGQNGGYVAGTEPGSGEGRTGLDTKVSSNW